MNNAVKLSLYFVLITLALWFGRQFYKVFSANSRAAASRYDQPAGEARMSTATSAQGDPSRTNDLAATAVAQANPATIAAVGQTNITGGLTPANAVSVVTNDSIGASASNDVAAQSIPPTAAPPPPSGNATLPRSSASMIGYLGAFVGTMILLGLLIANDVSQFMANRTLGFVFNDEGEGMRNPEYDEAESVWANGDHLEAIRLMREYLAKNPREQYVALRIAEIYEKDLHNYLAAALEYEVVLTHEIESERWGWAAIHLCNLYSKMGQTDKAVGLLRRIESERSQTAAAGKARKRLALYDAAGEQALQPEEQAPPETS